MLASAPAPVRATLSGTGRAVVALSAERRLWAGPGRLLAGACWGVCLSTGVHGGPAQVSGGRSWCPRSDLAVSTLDGPCGGHRLLGIVGDARTVQERAPLGTWAVRVQPLRVRSGRAAVHRSASGHSGRCPSASGAAWRLVDTLWAMRCLPSIADAFGAPILRDPGPDRLARVREGRWTTGEQACSCDTNETGALTLR
jgi:hypothetical protein